MAKKQRMVNLHFIKTQRLLKPIEFKLVFNKPVKKIHSEHLLLFIGQGDGQPRLGLAITKKKIKNATDRNCLKRQTREIFRINQHILPSMDYVLIVKKSPFIYPMDKKLVKTIIYQELTDIFNKCAKISVISS